MVKDVKIWGRVVFPPSNSFILCMFLFLCCLLLLPNGEDARVQRFGNMHLAAIFCLGLYAMRLNVWAGALLSYCALFMALTVSEAPILAVLIISGGFFCFIASRDKIDSTSVYNLVCIMALCNVVWQVMQRFGVFLINIPLHNFEYMRVGLMSNSNETAALLAICLPCFFRRGWFWLIPAVALGLYMSDSHGGILAAILVCIVYAAVHFRRMVAALVALVLISSLALFVVYERPMGSLSQSSRAAAYKVALDSWLYNPNGWGIGQFKYVFPLVSSFHQVQAKKAGQDLLAYAYDRNSLKRLIDEKQANDSTFFKNDRVPEIFLELHNEYLEWLFNAGWIGLLLFLGGLISVFRIGFRTKNLSTYGLLAACLSALWFFPWHIIPTALISVFYVGDIVSEVT